MQSIHPAITLFPYTSPLLTSATHPCPAPQHSITPRSPPSLSPTPAPFYHLQHPSISTRGEPPACRPPRSPAYLARPENPASCLPNAATPPSHHPPSRHPLRSAYPGVNHHPRLPPSFSCYPPECRHPAFTGPRAPASPPASRPPSVRLLIWAGPSHCFPPLPGPHLTSTRGEPHPLGRPRIGSPAAGASPRLSIAANPLYHLHHPHPALAALPRGKTPRPAVARLTPPCNTSRGEPQPPRRPRTSACARRPLSPHQILTSRASTPTLASSSAPARVVPAPCRPPEQPAPARINTREEPPAPPGRPISCPAREDPPLGLPAPAPRRQGRAPACLSQLPPPKPSRPRRVVSASRARRPRVAPSRRSLLFLPPARSPAHLGQPLPSIHQHHQPAPPPRLIVHTSSHPCSPFSVPPRAHPLPPCPAPRRLPNKPTSRKVGKRTRTTSTVPPALALPHTLTRCIMQSLHSVIAPFLYIPRRP